MFRKIPYAVAGATLVIALACTTTPSRLPIVVSPPVGAAMDDSFVIPDGGALSHAPAVVFTPDGRMLAATAASEIVVFDAGTRKHLRRVRLPEPATDGIAIDPSGRCAAWVLKSGGLAVMEIASGRVLARDTAIKAKWLAFSPDARRLAVACGHTLEIRRTQTLAPERAHAHDGDVTAVAWSADGTMLASTSQDGRLSVHRGDRLVYDAKKAEPLYAAAFHPSGGAVAYGGRDKLIYRYDFAAREETVVSKNQPYFITALGYSPDGALLAVGDESCDIWLFGANSSEPAFHNKHHNECWLSAVAWSPDGGTFLFGCRPNGHHGKPTIHAPLARAEAARSSAARASREELLAAVDDAIANERDGRMRDRLVAYRKATAGEEQPGAWNAPGNWAGYIAWPATNNVTSTEIGPEPDAGAAPVNLNAGVAPHLLADPGLKLPPAVQALAKTHDTVVQEEVRRLSRDYRFNVWRAKRPQ